MPLAIARAASMAERLSLNALGATRILNGVECDGIGISKGIVVTRIELGQ
jgi:hypothetical protein